MYFTKLNNEQTITGLPPLNSRKRIFFYKDEGAMPLSPGLNEKLGRSPQIFVIIQHDNDMQGRSPQIFVTNNKTTNQRGVALT